ncbi:hypothetical protein [Lichenicoccus sp.]|uniref:hypothetical protein n=1 Tax=Lichenicoccus sp. TaxID=2781899 RepID=UPI003D0F0496
MTSRILRFASPAIAVVMIGFAVHAARAEDSVDSLLRDPKHLDEVQAGCKANAPGATESVCRTASEALRRRFLGQGVPYTPHRVDPFPSRPTMKLPAPPATKPEAHHRPAPQRPSAIL